MHNSCAAWHHPSSKMVPGWLQQWCCSIHSFFCLIPKSCCTLFWSLGLYTCTCIDLMPILMLMGFLYCEKLSSWISQWSRLRLIRISISRQSDFFTFIFISRKLFIKLLLVAIKKFLELQLYSYWYRIKTEKIKRNLTEKIISELKKFKRDWSGKW